MLLLRNNKFHQVLLFLIKEEEWNHQIKFHHKGSCYWETYYKFKNNICKYFYPKYFSHYNKAHNPHKKYLRPDLRLKTMYDLYKKFCLEEKNVQAEKESYYRTVMLTQSLI